MSGPSRRTVTAGGVELSLCEWGDRAAPTLVFWHGMGFFSGGGTDANVAGPAWADAGWHVVAPDAPGYGESPALDPDEYRVERLAAIATALVEELGPERPAWVGFSWGGRIGLRVAPERLRGLALLDAGYLLFEERPDAEERRGESRRLLADDPELRPSFESRDAFIATARRFIEVDGPTEERLQAAMVERGGRIEPRIPARALGTALAAMREEPELPLHPRLARSGIPVLLLAATEPPEWEEARAPALARFAERVPQAEVHRVGATHDVLNEAPDEVIPLVAAWLARLRG